jgi:hypothetical protein
MNTSISTGRKQNRNTPKDFLLRFVQQQSILPANPEAQQSRTPAKFEPHTQWGWVLRQSKALGKTLQRKHKSD